MSSHPELDSLGSLSEIWRSNQWPEELNLDYDGKRDRWNGFQPDDYKQVIEAGSIEKIWKELDFASKASICWPPFLDKNGFHWRFPEIFHEFSMVFLGFPMPPVSSTIFPHVFGATAPAHAASARTGSGWRRSVAEWRPQRWRNEPNWRSWDNPVSHGHGDHGGDGMGLQLWFAKKNDDGFFSSILNG